MEVTRNQSIYVLITLSTVAFLATSSFYGHAAPVVSLGDGLYKRGDTYFLQGVTQSDREIIPPDCMPYPASCETALDFNITSPEETTMVYNAPLPTYAELDFLGPSGHLSEVTRHTASDSGFIIATLPCNFGTYRYLFIGTTSNASQYAVTVGLRVVSTPYSGTCR